MTQDRNDEAAPALIPGSVRRVTSAANPLIKDIRSLTLKKNRARSGRFLAEGIKLVRDALIAGWPPQIVLAADTERPVVAETLAAARAAGAAVLETTAAVLERVARRENPQTVIGVFAQRWSAMPSGAANIAGTWVALDRVRDPGNLGTIVRTADAAGARGVILVGDCADPFGLEAVRATMGSIFHVPLVAVSSADFIAWCSTFNGIVVGTHLKGSVDYRAPRYCEPALLVMGAEQSGLSDDVTQVCDVLARIPMAGHADSLNLAISTGIMLYEMRRNALPPSRRIGPQDA